MANYEIVRVRKRWEVRADGIVRGTFDSEREATRAAQRLFEGQGDARRRTSRLGRRQKSEV